MLPAAAKKKIRHLPWSLPFRRTGQGRNHEHENDPFTGHWTCACCQPGVGDIYICGMALGASNHLELPPVGMITLDLMRQVLVVDAVGPTDLSSTWKHTVMR